MSIQIFNEQLEHLRIATDEVRTVIRLLYAIGLDKPADQLSRASDDLYRARETLRANSAAELSGMLADAQKGTAETLKFALELARFQIEPRTDEVPGTASQKSPP
jgi:hypothetical protein